MQSESYESTLDIDSAVFEKLKKICKGKSFDVTELASAIFERILNDETALAEIIKQSIEARDEET